MSITLEALLTSMYQRWSAKAFSIKLVSKTSKLTNRSNIVRRSTTFLRIFWSPTRKKELSQSTRKVIPAKPTIWDISTQEVALLKHLSITLNQTLRIHALLSTLSRMDNGSLSAIIIKLLTKTKQWLLTLTQLASSLQFRSMTSSRTSRQRNFLGISHFSFSASLINKKVLYFLYRNDEEAR